MLECYIKVEGSSKLDYQIILKTKAYEKYKYIIYSNTSKNCGFNEKIWVVEDIDNLNVCLISTNLNTICKKYINFKEDLTHVEMPLDKELYEFIQNTFLKELDHYLTLDSVSQEYYVVKNKIINKLSNSNELMANDFQFTTEIKNILNIENETRIDEKSIIKLLKKKNEYKNIEKEIKEHAFNKNFFKKAVVVCPEVIQYIDESILMDFKFLHQLIGLNREVLMFLPDRIKTNFDFLKDILKNNGSLLNFCDNEIKSNKELVMVSVENNGCALQFADEKLKNDVEVVNKAVNNAGPSIAYANNSFKNDIELILQGVKNNASTLKWINQDLLSSKDFILKCAALNGRVLKFLDDNLKNDLEVVVECLKNRQDIYELIPNVLKSNPKVKELILKPSPTDI